MTATDFTKTDIATGDNPPTSPTVQADSLCYLTATDAGRMFRSGDLSPVELMRAVIQRSEDVNPKVNAYTYTFFDRALEQARIAERKFAQGAEVGPLEGIPTVIKDLHPVEGEISTWGSKVYEGLRSEYTAPTVQRLFDAGAIMHARTTTPEFGHTGHCHSPLWGATRNPWNTDFSSGGSSGGSGVAVAAGMTTIGDGTDGGGSIRIPASACGIFGFKPSFGRNPTGILGTNVESILHFGPMTRSVADAVLMQNVMSGPTPKDITTLRPKLELPTDLEPVSRLKIALSPDLGFFEVDKEVEANTLAAARAFEELGCEVEIVDLGWDFSVLDAWVTHWEGLFATLCAPYLPRWQYEMDPFVRGMLQRGAAHSATRVKATEFVRAEMYEKLAPVLDQYDALVCPTLAVPSVPAEHKCDDPDFTINGKSVDAFIQWCMTYPFNLVGQCPVATVPTGFASSGVPTGMQIVGQSYDDLNVLRIASSFEAIRPWASNVPSL
jgi:aspartyl-tRNA(Asn)/glutamyl-tRNA(Gln) amidotransferase subunit A